MSARTLTEEDLDIAELATRLTQKLDWALEFDDRFSAACTGLIAASRDHDPDKSSWRKYASDKARFAIHDEFRLRAGRKGQKVIKFRSINDRSGLADPAERGRDTHADTVEELARKLSPQSGEVFRLHWLHGLEGKEIASRLGLSKSRISQILVRAYAILREVITPDFFAKEARP